LNERKNLLSENQNLQIEKRNKPPRKVKLNANSLKELINFHKNFKMKFVISLSNYTSLFKSDLYNLHFLKKSHSFQMFSVYNKIKADLKELPIPVDIRYIKYYQTNFNTDKLYADKIYQIDIKSCYASILKNNKLISDETFANVCKLSKENRLAAIGMLASRKNIFHFDETGNVYEHEQKKSDTSDYFFFCVQETFRIMDECKHILGDDFLFIWVDAIYFKGDMNKANEVVNYFKSEHNLDSCINELFEFEVEMRKDFYRLRYIKGKDKTFMDIPMPEQSEKTELLNYLLNIKHQKYVKPKQFGKI